MRTPPPLRPGDPVAVVAPASPPRNVDRYRTGLRALRARYDVRTAYGPNAAPAPLDFLAAADVERTEAVNAALCDPSIRAIFCVRGGYGAMRLLPHLAYDAATPTWVIGYSDITALHLALYQRLGWVGLSGPVVTEWPLVDAPMQAALDATLNDPHDWTAATSDDGPVPLRTGAATGPLLGGNLSVLSRLIGTPYLPSLDGAILVLEDVAEAPYRVDRMLAHCALAGLLDGLAGVVLGRFRLPEHADTEAARATLTAIFRDYFAARPYPVATHLRYGHLMPRTVLPIGLPVALRVTDRAVTLRAA
ncbi:S66 peptidase family protein [Salisaeta longa]|uniref:S66 peptidase family protein n=1 Tax=Salisaeta longa TaxID=503170 RepID=UPI0003B43145|nr:LD-carboxypeptidase [Salisaeta longa]